MSINSPETKKQCITAPGQFGGTGVYLFKNGKLENYEIIKDSMLSLYTESVENLGYRRAYYIPVLERRLERAYAAYREAVEALEKAKYYPLKLDVIEEDMLEKLIGGWRKIDTNKLAAEHDKSKNDPEEYDAYDNYFYGRNRSCAVVEYFNKAWLRHIHKNPHHWQHWVLINDDPKLGETCIEIPYQYVMEMICDWWSFSWKENNLFEIFRWYEDHKAHIKLHPDTRKLVEAILKEMQKKLYESEEYSELMEEEEDD